MDVYDLVLKKRKFQRYLQDKGCVYEEADNSGDTMCYFGYQLQRYNDSRGVPIQSLRLEKEIVSVRSV